MTLNDLERCNSLYFALRNSTDFSVMHLNSLRKKNEHLTVDAVYSICGSTSPVVSTVTDLGVSYDNKFSFRPHITSIVSKASLRAN